MASKKAQAALLRQKEAKQKKVLFVLVPVFLALAAWQGPKTFKAVTGGNTPPPQTSAAPATTTGAPTPGSAPSTPGAGAPASSQLVDTDSAPSAQDGQLTNFSVFPSRDPFSGGPKPPGAPSSPATGSGTTTSGTTGTTPTSARLQVNGATETVAINGTFPDNDPVFKLVSVTANSAFVALSSGQKFTNGDATEELKVGETLTVAGDDGSSFSIKLLSTGSS
jgi:cytoskeletal protein RodZ